MDDLELYEYCHKVSRAMFGKYRVSMEDREDYATEAYIKCRGVDIERPCVYIPTVLMNLWRDVIKTKRGQDRRNPLSLDEDIYETQSDYDGLDNLIVLWELIERVESDYPHFAEVLIMDATGCTALEGCTNLGLSLPAYKSRLYQARKKVKQIA